MTTLEAVGYLIAAVRAVAPEALARPVDVGDLLDWIADGHPVEQVLATLSDRERADVRKILDGMLRERRLQRAR